jgi:hypothetical protein
MNPFNLYIWSNNSNYKLYLFAYSATEIDTDQIFSFYNSNYLATQSIIRNHNLWDDVCIYNGVFPNKDKVTFKQFYKLYGDGSKINSDNFNREKTETLLEILLFNWNEWN